MKSQLARQHHLKRSPVHEQLRRTTNVAMLGLTGLMTALAIVPLAWIMFEVFARGSSAMSPAFLTDTFKPTSIDNGGGVWACHRRHGHSHRMGNAALGADWHPGRVYVSEHPNTTLDWQCALARTCSPACPRLSSVCSFTR